MLEGRKIDGAEDDTAHPWRMSKKNAIANTKRKNTWPLARSAAEAKFNLIWTMESPSLAAINPI